MVDNFQLKMLKEKGGFTLIEMLVVIAMIGILSAVVLTALGPSRLKAKDSRIISDVNQARAIAEGYYNATDGSYPMKSIESAISSTVADANANFSGTKTCNSNALCIYPPSSQSSTSQTFAIYGQLNAGGYFCSDSTGVTKQNSGDLLTTLNSTCQ
jgi:prepilin-type N-terminal cleavage/methylation domain-containing protein